MKTPMQEHIEWLDTQWGNAKDCGEKTIDFEIAMKHAESMLEKEKEFMQKIYANAKTTGEMDEAVRTFNNKEI